MRAVSTTGILPENFDDPDWYALRAAFSNNIPDQHLNVVCGFGDELTKRHAFALKNIAITACNPRVPNTTELDSLKKYTVVCGAGLKSTVQLQDAGLPACVTLEPKPAAVVMLLSTHFAQDGML